jgi:phosphoribosylamine--glycine ligase
MGSFAPAEKVVTEEVIDKVRQRIIDPVLTGMEIEGNKFTGCLYCGLMVDKDNDPYVIEFNVRLGDPEAQVVLPMVKSDLFELMYASADAGVNEYELSTFGHYYVCVVLASKGYPEKYETGKEITWLDKAGSDCIIFHAGTKEWKEIGIKRR